METISLSAALPVLGMQPLSNAELDAAIDAEIALIATDPAEHADYDDGTSVLLRDLLWRRSVRCRRSWKAMTEGTPA